MTIQISSSTNGPALATSFALVAATAALIALEIGLLTLVGRERKSPYVINAGLPIFIISLIVAALSVLAPLLPSSWAELIIRAATWLLFAALAVSIYQLYRITVRFVYFIDSLNPKHLPGIRHVRRWLASLQQEPGYAHAPLDVPEALTIAINNIITRHAVASNFEDDATMPCLAIAVNQERQVNRLLAELAEAFLRQDFTIQYMTAIRHPSEFLEYLKRSIEEHSLHWRQLTEKIVALDAYTPHFGFIDSIHGVKSQDLRRQGLSLVTSPRTYAGVHSASSKAFNMIKRRVGKTYRPPTLVIYEGGYALADLESAEQYRVFIRHVIPSERMWGAMFTVFVESSPAQADWEILCGYTGRRLDLRLGKGGLTEDDERT